MATFWITKYALTAGIFEIDSKVGEYGRVKDTRPGAMSFNSFTHGKEAFESKADAITDAERRRKRRLDGLRKQFTKLEGLKFA